ncbi:MAG: energy transducer TonB [Methylomonas sp.]|nr:MAG: energy transducer TonB [Methylomonas sp.]
MSAFSHRLIEFPDTKTRPYRNPSAHRKIVALPPIASARPVLAVVKRGYYRQSLMVAAALAVSLHAALLALPKAQPAETITPPVPIQVQWLANPAQEAKAAVTPVNPGPSKPLPDQPKAKAKAKTAPKSKPLLTSQSSHPQPADVPAPQPIPAAEVAKPAADAGSPPSSADHPDTDKNLTQAPDSLPHLNAAYLNNPAPDYPPTARAAGEQGKVLLKALIDHQGHVAEISVRKTSGYPRLDHAALNSVKQWRFVPAQRQGETVAAWVLVPVLFDLEG